MDERDVARAAIQATGLVKKGVQAKAAAVGLVIFFVGLLLLGSFFPGGGEASAASCEDTGAGTSDASPTSSTPTRSSGRATGTLRDQQITYAKTIDSVAKKNKLPGRATLIALMTAMQESTLQDLDHGPPGVDAIGLFQQRPSMGWGTKAQIMKPAFAAESFFEGRGTNKGLADVAGWQKMPLHKAAEAVQHSGQGKLYAGHETAMRKLAKDAGINLEHDANATASTSKGTRPKPVTSENHGCGVNKPTAPGGAGGSAGGKFTDGTQTWKLNNPRSVKEAIAWAKKTAGQPTSANWYQRCLAFTAIAYGWSVSGVNYAIDHYQVVPASMRHDGDRHPPAGALMYWDTHHRAGHIAIYLGDGKVASNDILRPGFIDVVDAELIETKWGSKYIGWTPPIFPRAG
ncbi:peptidase M23 [Streptomyces nigrescens]|uniref:peptidase M23 n=1 Tax=Streptomyces nigrescens TaxID=1920 RepID=UPI0036FEDCAA